MTTESAVSRPISFNANGLFDQSYTRLEVFTPSTTAAKWCLPLIQRLGAHSRTSVWQVGYDGVENPGHLILQHGDYKIINIETFNQTLDGTVQTVMSPIVLNESGRNHNVQALLNAKSRHLKNCRNGYTALASELSLAKGKQPMLATVFRDGTDGKKPTKPPLPLIANMKIDGVRMLASSVPAESGLEGGVRLRSRQDKDFKFMAHIRRALAILLAFLPGGCEVDGEFYNHEVKFLQKIASIVSVNATAPHANETLISYYIYDITLALPYVQRFAVVQQAYEQYLSAFKEAYPDLAASPILLVPYFTIDATNFGQLQVYRDYYINQKYEGLVLRRADRPYHHGRSVDMYKYKLREETEGTIKGFEEWKKKPGFARFIIDHEDSGKTFKCCMDVDDATNRYLFSVASQLIGKIMTYTYEDESEAGIPKQPRGKAIRDYE